MASIWLEDLLCHREHSGVAPVRGMRASSDSFRASDCWPCLALESPLRGALKRPSRKEPVLPSDHSRWRRRAPLRWRASCREGSCWHPISGVASCLAPLRLAAELAHVRPAGAAGFPGSRPARHNMHVSGAASHCCMRRSAELYMYHDQGLRCNTLILAATCHGSSI